MAKEEIVLHEYGMIRTEINNSFNSSKKILTIGLIIIAAMFTGGVLDQLNNLGSGNMGALQPLLSILCLILGIPLVALAVFALWLGEYQRIQRAGIYLIDFEKRVNKYFGSNNELLLNWENYLDDKKLHPNYLYPAITALIVSIHTLSHIAGAFIINHSVTYKWYVIQAVFFIFQGIGFGYLINKHKQVRSKIDKIRNKSKKAK